MLAITANKKAISINALTNPQAADKRGKVSFDVYQINGANKIKYSIGAL